MNYDPNLAMQEADNHQKYVKAAYKRGVADERKRVVEIIKYEKAAYKRGVADERKRITDFIKGTGFDEEDIAYLIQSIERDEKED